MFRKSFLVLTLLTGFLPGLFAQEYAVAKIPFQLLENANAVIRSEITNIEVLAVDKMMIRTRRAVTVLNQYGDRHTMAGEVFDGETKIRSQQVMMFDAAGKMIRKSKKSDFKKRSYIGSGNLISDTRLRYYDFTPVEYPYTMVYESEVQSANTVFVNPWQPLSSYFLSVEASEYILQNTSGIPLRLLEQNFTYSNRIEKLDSGADLHYRATMLEALKREHLSPGLNALTPEVKVALKEFSLVGVQGKAENWKEFGHWQYQNLLKGKRELPESTLKKIKKLTAGAENDLEKARRIYRYVQENTRYVSIQLGIGGWEPMTAAQVDELGYGDCKALTNYTKALLESQHILSHYAVVYAKEFRNIESEFASMQGDHVILNLPLDGQDLWLECTSQTTPFNYLGDFTDNRKALLVKPDGGEIVKTTKYGTTDNLEETWVRIDLEKNGGFSAEFQRQSGGIPYGDIYGISRKGEKDQVQFYKERWGHLQHLDLRQLEFQNDLQDQKFTEKLHFSGKKYATNAGNALLLPLFMFPAQSLNLPRDPFRKFPLEVRRGRAYKQVFEFYLPEGFSIESVPEPVAVETMFGNYRQKVTAIKEKDGGLLKVERHFAFEEGSWEPAMYQAYRDFLNSINILDNQKVMILADN